MSILPFVCPAQKMTPLMQHAANLRDTNAKEAFDPWGDAVFPMYVVAQEAVLSMTNLQPHETLLLDRILQDFDQCEGNAMFVSHQWAGLDHPDPTFEQFKVLQAALSRMSRRPVVSANIGLELYTGQQPYNATGELSKRLFIWYDYFSIPQADKAARSKAIAGIPRYVRRCRLFAILCPHIYHSETNTLLNKSTWKSRGWCRLEQAVRALSVAAGEEDVCPIEIQSSTQQALVDSWDWARAPVGDGQFSLDSDRAKLAPVFEGMLRRKLNFLLARGEFHDYRMLLNSQRLHLRGLPIDRMVDLIPGFVSDQQDPAAHDLALFMHLNGFQEVTERTPEGWTPICFAALDGSPMLIASLLEQGADMNASISKEDSLYHFMAGTGVPHMCAFLGHNEALRFLIDERADLGKKDAIHATPLHWAAIGSNLEGLDTLLNAGCNVHEPNILGHSPFELACMSDSTSCMRELLPYVTKHTVSLGLHATFIHGGSSANMVQALIDANADVNHQQAVPTFSVLGAVFGVLSMKQRFFQNSMLGYYAYHQYDATPLMCSILAGCFEATAVLLEAGAKTDLKNLRGQTALDFAEDLLAPDHIVSALQARGSPGRRSQQGSLILDDKPTDGDSYCCVSL